MENLEIHLNHLEQIVQDTQEKMEGNCFYLHHTFDRSEKLLPKQRNLQKIAKQSKNILEIGFNAGHSALVFLLSNPNSKIVCFDLGEHSYSKKCFEYLSQQFPNRLEIIWGDSQTTLLKYVCENIGKKTFDLFHIDGGHFPEIVESDVKLSKFLANENSLLIYDDCWIKSLGFYFMKELYGKILDIVENVFEPTEQYSHLLCRFIPSTIAICTLVIGKEFREATYYSLLGKIRYCMKRGYDLICDESVYDSSRPAAWSKINLLLKTLNDYHFVLWIDADTYIMNKERKVEDYIVNNDMLSNREMMISKDEFMLNTGVWLIRNTDFSRKFLSEIYKQNEFIEHGNWEQTACIQLYEQNFENAKEKITTPFHKDINSYWYNFVWEDFIIHFPGCRKLAQLELVMEMYNPEKRWDETEENWWNRIHWIMFESVEYSKKKLAWLNSNAE